MADGTRMRQRRATKAQWDTSNYVLADGEIGVEKDTGVIKFGNGTTPWTQLPAAFGSTYLPILGKAADSERLDGISSEAFLQKTEAALAYLGKSAKAADSEMLDGKDSTLFLTKTEASDTYPTKTQFYVPEITSTTRPSSPAKNQKYKETDTGDVVAWDGTRWVKVGGPPRLITSIHNSGGTGNVGATAGSFFPVRSISVPAHTVGVLRCQYQGIWAAASAQALHGTLYYGVGGSVAEIAGARMRSHNNGLINAPTSMMCEGYWNSDGSAKTLFLYTMAEVVASTAMVDGPFRVWLEAAPI